MQQFIIIIFISIQDILVVITIMTTITRRIIISRKKEMRLNLQGSMRRITKP